MRETTWLIFAPNVKAIRLFWCKELEEVISKEILCEVSEKMDNLNPFSKLQSLEIFGAEILKSIYWKALLSPQLKKIDVMKCPNLQKLPLDSNSTEGRKLVIRGQEDWWKELQWEDEATRNAFLLCFEPLQD
ncbi:hypothetical protein Dsin_013583 [Dipteronia sinensis]|uniref:Uncharacterized protein n=1 Tax=Dipteronia sinensis TaxID=43782 RepID=A0AAE0AK87_9ROSI|nr:hypothetical protein Dsin_013583 [Dipteronia sinensis]